MKKRVKELHPYDVPEIISLKIKDGLYEYLKWIDEATG
ncbi:MAG: divalent cation tolerance protein CutA [Deltaproteobacteria bacterium]